MRSTVRSSGFNDAKGLGSLRRPSARRLVHFSAIQSRASVRSPPGARVEFRLVMAEGLQAATVTVECQ